MTKPESKIISSIENLLYDSYPAPCLPKPPVKLVLDQGPGLYVEIPWDKVRKILDGVFSKVKENKHKLKEEELFCPIEPCEEKDMYRIYMIFIGEYEK